MVFANPFLISLSNCEHYIIIFFSERPTVNSETITVLSTVFRFINIIGKHLLVFPTGKAKKAPNSVALWEICHMIRH